MRAREWLPAVIGVVLGVAGGLALVQADRYVTSFTGQTGAPEAVLPILLVVLIASAMVLVRLAALSAVRRPASGSVRPPSPAYTLAWLLATIALAVVALGSVRIGFGGVPRFGPALAVTVAALVFVGALASFARHARRLALAADPYFLVARLGESAVLAAGGCYPAELPAQVPPLPPVKRARVFPAPRSGYVSSVDTVRLARLARKANAIISVPAVGAFVAKGTPLLEVHSLDGRSLPAKVATGVRLTDIRDAERDCAFALGLLSDVAVSALPTEPGVSEAALDRIGVVLGLLGPRPFPTGCFTDAAGDVRVIQPVLGWSRLVEIALSDVVYHAAGDPRVHERVSVLIDEISRKLPPDRAMALGEYLPLPPFMHPMPEVGHPRVEPRVAAPSDRPAHAGSVPVIDLESAGRRDGG